MNDPIHPPEFDAFADDYADLIADPWRDRFAGDPLYFHHRKLNVLQEFVAGLGLSTSELRWLDLGCGRGDLLKLGAHGFGYACGCDVSKESLKFCEEFSVKLQPSVETLPFDDGSVDVVTAACVYHHVRPSERLGLTRSAYRVLKPGGIFCIFEHNPYNPITKTVVRRSPVDVNAILLNSRETVALMKGAGFHVYPVQYFLFIPTFARRFVSMERLLGRVPLGGQYAVFGRRLPAVEQPTELKP